MGPLQRYWDSLSACSSAALAFSSLCLSESFALSKY